VIGASDPAICYIHLQNKLWQVQREIFKWRFSSYILTSVCEYILITLMQHWWMYGVEFFWQRMCPLENCSEDDNEY
jgi:hypothetical protein